MTIRQTAPFSVVIKKPTAARRAIAQQNAKAMADKALEKLNAAYDRAKS